MSFWPGSYPTVWRRTWHNVWKSLQYVWITMAPVLWGKVLCDCCRLHEYASSWGEATLSPKVFMCLSVQPFHHSFIPWRRSISQRTHMKMCVRWRMSSVFTCGCDILQVRRCDASTLVCSLPGKKQAAKPPKAMQEFVFNGLRPVQSRDRSLRFVSS